MRIDGSDCAGLYHAFTLHVSFPCALFDKASFHVLLNEQGNETISFAL